MSIEFRCPQCGQALQAGADQSGSDMLCPACRHSFPIPPETRPAARPTSLTVFGVLSIVFGSLGLICTPVNLVSMRMLPSTQALTDGYRAWMVASGVFGLLVSAVLLAVGIGLLRRRAWARTGAIAYGICAIVFSLVGIGMNCLMIRDGVFGTEEAQIIGGYIGTVAGGLFGLIFPIVLIIFMTRPRIVAACDE
jgi:hypothetical protein